MKWPYFLSNLVLCCCFAFPLSVCGQGESGDSLIRARAVSYAVSLYHQNLGFQSALLNANAYSGFPFRFEESHPFFYSEQPDTGSIEYDGVFFEKVLLSYNEIFDVVITRATGSMLELVSEKVRNFSLYNHHFVRLTRDSAARRDIADGFYDVLYDGKTSLYKKEIKSVREEIKGGTEGILRFINVQNVFYVRKGPDFYAVRSKKDVMKIFASKEDDIRHFIRKNKLKYRKDKTKMLMLTTAYFDQITK